jgi:ComF family protein
VTTIFKNIASSISHLLFPHNCLGCCTDVLNSTDQLCARCATEIPTTNYFNVANNPIDKTFIGRVRVENAAAGFYYTKESLVQHLMVQLKYKKNQDVGLYLGKLIGYELQKSSRFDTVDVLVPLPLNAKKEHKRGYNQAMVICQGIASVWQKPIVEGAVIRTVFTETQTNQNRMNRWQNMDGVFAIANAQAIEGKHILLVDDVVTTGATLDSCGNVILQVANTKLSIACVACASF